MRIIDMFLRSSRNSFWSTTWIADNGSTLISGMLWNSYISRKGSDNGFRDFEFDITTSESPVVSIHFSNSHRTLCCHIAFRSIRFFILKNSTFVLRVSSFSSQHLVESTITTLVTNLFPDPSFVFFLPFHCGPLNRWKYLLLKYRFLQKRRRNERFRGCPRKTRTLKWSVRVNYSRVQFSSTREGLDFHGNQNGKKCRYSETWFPKGRVPELLGCVIRRYHLIKGCNAYYGKRGRLLRRLPCLVFSYGRVTLMLLAICRLGSLLFVVLSKFVCLMFKM